MLLIDEGKIIWLIVILFMSEGLSINDHGLCISTTMYYNSFMEIQSMSTADAYVITYQKTYSKLSWTRNTLTALLDNVQLIQFGKQNGRLKVQKREEQVSGISSD